MDAYAVNLLGTPRNPGGLLARSRRRLIAGLEADARRLRDEVAWLNEALQPHS